jgi:hypothetical protein
MLVTVFSAPDHVGSGRGDNNSNLFEDENYHEVGSIGSSDSSDQSGMLLSAASSVASVSDDVIVDSTNNDDHNWENLRDLQWWYEPQHPS